MTPHSSQQTTPKAAKKGLDPKRAIALVNKAIAISPFERSAAGLDDLRELEILLEMQCNGIRQAATSASPADGSTKAFEESQKNLDTIRTLLHYYRHLAKSDPSRQGVSEQGLMNLIRRKS